MAVIDAAVAGAVLLAGQALSAGNHMITGKRVSKLEKDNKLKSIEITALEFTVITGVGCYFVDKHIDKKRREKTEIQFNAQMMKQQEELNANRQFAISLEERVRALEMAKTNNTQKEEIPIPSVEVSVIEDKK